MIIFTKPLGGEYARVCDFERTFLLSSLEQTWYARTVVTAYTHNLGLSLLLFELN